MMLRLLRDGKIAGFKEFGRRNHPYQVVFYYDASMCEVALCPLHHSFELGVKVDDEWWFEGDKFTWKEYFDDSEFDLGEGTLYCDEMYGFYLAKYRPLKLLLYMKKADLKRIGNIHKEG